MITLSEQAAKKVRRNLERRGSGVGVRVGVKTTGCSGLAYTLEYVDTVDPLDTVFVSFNIQIYVDPKSLVYIDGMTMDWIRQGLNEGFDFKNAKEKDRCGCGESFRI